MGKGCRESSSELPFQVEEDHAGRQYSNELPSLRLQTPSSKSSKIPEDVRGPDRVIEESCLLCWESITAQRVYYWFRHLTQQSQHSSLVVALMQAYLGHILPLEAQGHGCNESNAFWMKLSRQSCKLESYRRGEGNRWSHPGLADCPTWPVGLLY